MKRKLMLLVACLFVMMGFVTAQTSTIQGIVTSEEDGEPIVGASVLVEGTSMGTVTDVEGKFIIANVPSSAKTLRVSYIGLQSQSLPIRFKGVMHIVLKADAELLDEVIVVAYGTAKKASFTGSASVMKSSEISTQKQSLVKSLEGKVAGVRVGAATGDPGADQRILIRGISSISGSTQPLYVVDGVPVVNDNMTSGLKSQSVLSSINPDDIESMTILKDAAAASLYGSRAANGVVIITTKKGQEGKTRISYDMETGWSNIAVKGAIRMMNASQIKNYYWHSLKNYFMAYEDMDGTAAAAAADEEVPGWFYDWNGATDSNWQKEVYKNGLTTNHQVAINGGTEKTKFYVSFGYNKVKGVVAGSEFERYSGRLNLDHQVTPWLKISAKQMISFSNTEGFRDQNDQEQGFGTTAPMSIMFSMDPTAPIKLEDGSYNPHGSFNAKISNPNLMLGQSTGKYAETVASELMRSMTNFEAEIKLPYNFTTRTIFGYDYMDNKEREFWAPQSVNGQSLGGLGERFNYTNKTMTSSTTLNYAGSFSKHNLNALLGYEVEERIRTYMKASAKNYSTDVLPELANGQPYESSSSVNEAAVMSYLANVNYDYNNKYYLSGSFRRDGSSRLGKDNRWANFWSVSGAWRVSGEDFLKDNAVLSDLKLRVSYGTNGNLPGDYYGYMATFATTGGYGNSPAFYLYSAGNSKLGWEKSRNFNVGLDFGLFHRVNATLEYYNKLTTDLLFKVPTSYVTGFSSQWNNLGKLKNRGVELSVSSRNIETKDFSWNTDFNLAYQSIKVEKLPDGEDVQYGDGSMYLLREGEPMHTFYLPEFVGVNSETGLGEFWLDPSDHSKGVTNYYSKAGKGIVGKAVPDWMGGVTNRFSYKNFDLSFMISFQTGASMFDYPGYFLNYSDGVRVGSFNMLECVDGKYWTKPGDNAEYPKPIYSNPYRSDRFSSRTIRSTDNIRMRDITLGYRVPAPKKYVNNLRVYFKASNPFLIYCATDNIDPDVDINGYRQTDTPPTRSFVFGLNFEF